MDVAYSVSEFIDIVRERLTADFGEVVVQGEVVDFRPSTSQLVFFDIKDAQSRLRCFMLRHELKADLEDGMEIRVMGVPSLFKKNGGFHVRVSALELVGEGALKKAFLALQRTLEQEGLFAPEHKKALPRFPFHIGLITSPDAAAYTDVMHVLQNRFRGLHIVLYPAHVQGMRSVRDLVRAVRAAGANTDLDAMILTRGGGSLEDLQSFNTEEVARAIFASRVPVVVGVGHERDVTIADFVADVRAATPSNAAELTVPDTHDVLRQINAEQRRLIYGVGRSRDAMHMRFQTTFRRLESALLRPGERFRAARTSVFFSFQRLQEQHRHMREETQQASARHRAALVRLQQHLRDRIQHSISLLQSLSPHTVLQRGYSITYLTRKGESTILKNAAHARRGDQIKTRLAQGDIHSEVV